MKEIKSCRENLVNFLPITTMEKLNDLLKYNYNVNKQSFDDICDNVLRLYNEKLITNTVASKVFDILAYTNVSIKINSHRFEHGKIYKYDSNSKTYVFTQMGTIKEFNALNHYLENTEC